MNATPQPLRPVRTARPARLGRPGRKQQADRLLKHLPLCDRKRQEQIRLLIQADQLQL